MLLKVVGQRQSQDSLCKTCLNCLRIRGDGVSELRYCRAFLDSNPIPLKENVYSCSYYQDERKSNIHEMERIGWTLRTDPRTKRVMGFAPPKKEE